MNLLGNIFWHALTGKHTHFAIGSGAVRRYAPGYCAIAGFEQKDSPDFSALAALCEPGEHILCNAWQGAVPPDWQIIEETALHCMVWAGPIPANDPARDAIRLWPEHAGAAVDLADTARPGPLGIRSIELGEYYGYFDAGRLVAMAGERLAADGLREISGVCTHPAFAGRGMARRLVGKLVRRQLMRGETPFLHVAHDNVAARLLYRRMGFRDHCAAPSRIICRQAPA